MASTDQNPPAKRPKRGRGEGTITQLKKDLWRGQVMLGYRADGTRDRRTVYGKRRDEVKAKIDALRQQQRAATLAEPQRLTLGEFLGRWLEDVVRPRARPRTYESYAQQCRTHLVPALGSVRLSALRPHQLQRYYAQRLAAGLSGTTVRYQHAILHGALERARRWGLVAVNVADEAEPPRPNQAEMRFLTPQQVARLIETASAAGDRLTALWALAVYSGARQGELLGLRWADLDLDAGTVRVTRALQRVDGGRGTFAEPKTASSRRTIVVDADAVRLLREHRAHQDEDRRRLGDAYEDQGLVFCTRLGRPLSRFNVGRAFRAALRRAGVPQVRFHDLRHTSATLLTLAGVHLKQVQARLGHTNIQTTTRYSHLVQGMDGGAAELLGRTIRAGSASGAGETAGQGTEEAAGEPERS